VFIKFDWFSPLEKCSICSSPFSFSRSYQKVGKNEMLRVVISSSDNLKSEVIEDMELHSKTVAEETCLTPSRIMFHLHSQSCSEFLSFPPLVFRFNFTFSGTWYPLISTKVQTIHSKTNRKSHIIRKTNLFINQTIFTLQLVVLKTPLYHQKFYVIKHFAVIIVAFTSIKLSISIQSTTLLSANLFSANKKKAHNNKSHLFHNKHL
jgi:hypothetical protein